MSAEGPLVLTVETKHRTEAATPVASAEDAQVAPGTAPELAADEGGELGTVQRRQVLPQHLALLHGAAVGQRQLLQLRQMMPATVERAIIAVAFCADTAGMLVWTHRLRPGLQVHKNMKRS